VHFALASSARSRRPKSSSTRVSSTNTDSDSDAAATSSTSVHTTAKSVAAATDAAATVSTATNTEERTMEQAQAAPVQPPKPPRATVPDVYAPHVFRGEADEDPEEWVRHFQRYVECRDLTADEQKRFFPLFLKGKALDWFESLDATASATNTTIIAAFKANYSSDSLERVMESESMFNRSQRPGERTRDYVGEMRRLAHRLPNVTADTLRYVVLRGLLPHIKRHVIQSKFDTLDDILKAARVAELSETTAEAGNLSDVVAEVRASRAEVRQLTEKVNKMSLNAVTGPSRRSPTPVRRSPSPVSRDRRVTFGASSSSPKAPRQEWVRNRRPPVKRSVCYRCNRDHWGKPCAVVNLTCNTCHKKGHISPACKSGRRSQH